MSDEKDPYEEQQEALDDLDDEAPDPETELEGQERQARRRLYPAGAPADLDFTCHRRVAGDPDRDRVRTIDPASTSPIRGPACLAPRPSPSSCPARPRAGGFSPARRRWRSRSDCSSRELATLAERRVPVADDPFTLGVASGDPTPSGVVLWTRLAPDPLHGGGLAHAGPIAVDWVVARDERLRKVVSRGSGVRPARARAQRASGGRGPRAGPRLLLPVHRRRPREPDRPHPDGAGADRQLDAAADGLLLVRQLPGRLVRRRTTAWRRRTSTWCSISATTSTRSGRCSGVAGRVHTTPDAGPHANQLITLADYRNRHAQYKTDRSLQAAHAAAPWVVATDDHEVEQNYAGDDDVERGHRPGRVPAAAGGGVPGVLRAHAAPPPGAARRARHAALPAAPVRRPARPAHARLAAVPHRPARRLLDGGGPQAGAARLPPGPASRRQPRRDAARRRAGALAGWPA